MQNPEESAPAAGAKQLLEPVVLPGIVLRGSGTLFGTELSDDLTGDADGARLIGGAGSDVLRAAGTGALSNLYFEGDAGDDLLFGSAGSDIYVFNRGDGQDTILEEGGRLAGIGLVEAPADASDTLIFNRGVSIEQLWFQRHGEDLEISLIGTTDQITVSDWYLDEGHRIETLFVSGSTSRLLSAEGVETLVQAMASFALPAVGEVELPPAYAVALVGVIADSWEPLVV